MTDALQIGDWFDRHVEKEAGRDVVGRSERVGQLVGWAIALLFAIDFTILYTSDSRFFTSEFTNADALLFFGIAYLGIIPGLMRLILGRRNITRPLDLALSLSVFAATAWFLSNFPFDFNYLKEALPSSLDFLVSWIDDTIAKTIMVLTIIVNLFIIPYTMVLFLSVRRKLMGP